MKAGAFTNLPTAARWLPQEWGCGRLTANAAGWRQLSLRRAGNFTMSEKSENDGPGFVFMGANVDEQWKAAASKALIATLRQDEVPLGNLSLADQNWLTTALAYLIQIDESRKAENVFGSAYCIFEAVSPISSVSHLPLVRICDASQSQKSLFLR